MRITGLALRVVVLVLVASLPLTGCGSGREFSSDSATTPQAAAAQFVDLVGGAAQHRSGLSKACELVSPDVREGLQFNSGVRSQPEACATGLAMMAYYTGENAEVPQAQSFTGKVTDTQTRGDEATVDVAMTYKLAAGTKRYPTKLLLVRRAGHWQVATPSSVNILSASQGMTDARLRSVYRQQLAYGREVQRRHAKGQAASSTIAEGARPCPTAGASTAQDARGDLKRNEGMRRTPQQPGGADLVAVRHNADGDQLCFELQFAAPPAAEGGMKLKVRPDYLPVSITWTTDGRIVGQTGDDSDPTAVPVSATRSDDTLVVRVPRSAFADLGKSYRWAIENFLLMPGRRYAWVDGVPDDQTVTSVPAGGSSDHYIPHPSGG